jgi:hypothetical protein
MALGGLDALTPVEPWRPAARLSAAVEAAE